MGAGRIRVLDIGCGTMPYRSVFQRTGLCDAYDGADIEPQDGIALAARIDPSTQLMSVPDGAYDLVVHFQTAEHVRKPDVLFAECHRVLSAGGVMFCTVPFVFEYHAVPNDYYR